MEEMSDITVLTCTPESWEANKEEFTKQLRDHIVWKKIPLLNNTPLHNLADKQLVRFRGMVQDIYNPEFYLSSYEVQNKSTGEVRIDSGKYRDVHVLKENEEINYDSSKNVNSERETLYCVSIPGMNEWTLDRVSTSSNLVSTANNSGPSTSSGNSFTNAAKEGSKKQCVDNEEKGTSSSDCVGKNGKKTPNTNTEKKQNCSSGYVEYPMNFPIPSVGDKACIIKIYDDLGPFTINNVLEVVGFLSVDPAMAIFKPNDEREDGEDVNMEDELEEMALNPPPSLVPRIHVVSVKQLSHANPLLPTKCHDSWENVSKSLLEEARVIREELLLVLTQLLLGDQVAAEYMLCHLVSTIYLRNDAICLGKLSLNLFNIPGRDNYSKRLYEILTLMLPHSHYLPMTIENMNKLLFKPKKDYKTNRLSSGILQLSSNTHLILDETALSPGQLDTNGVNNITALGNLITHQRVEYDFQFYTMEFVTNVQVLTLSEGKSLLPSDIQVKLQPDSTFVNDLDALFAAARHYLKEPVLNRIRKYLTVVKLADYSLSEEMQKIVQDDFVEMRKNADLKVTADDLHSRLILGRYLSLSNGQQALTKEMWNRACYLEDSRKSNLSHGRSQ